MPIVDEKELQLKESLRTAEIKTMRKDLAQLRENETLRESQRVSHMPISTPQKNTVPIAPPLPQPITSQKIDIAQKQQLSITPPPPPLPQRNPITPKPINQTPSQPAQMWKKPAPQNNQEDIKLQAKQYASEEEKQKMFLLESERANLKNQLQKGSNGLKPGSSLEGNRVLAELKNWQDKLNPLIKETEQITTEQKALEVKEQDTNIPSERKSFEAKRWQLEDERQKIEKKRWSLEQNIAKLEAQINTINEGHKAVNDNEVQMQNKMAEIDATLKRMYAAIIEREEERKIIMVKEEKAKKVEEKKEHIQVKKAVEEHQENEKEYLKKMPVAAKEKLAHISKTEDEQRRKFMEDVERWAAASEQSDHEQK